MLHAHDIAKVISYNDYLEDSLCQCMNNEIWGEQTTLLMDLWDRSLALSFTGFGSIKIRTPEGIYLGSSHSEAKDPKSCGSCILLG
jgi:hypothetical protein